jgi:hypothetical protein
MLRNTMQTREADVSMATTPTALALLTEKQTAHYLCVSLSYLRKARCEGTVGKRTPGPAFVRVGIGRGRVMYPRSECDAWLAGLERRR